jgi:hypothetical protein
LSLPRSSALGGPLMTPHRRPGCGFSTYHSGSI